LDALDPAAFCSAAVNRCAGSLDDDAASPEGGSGIAD
jgi:hypothetical protein